MNAGAGTFNLSNFINTNNLITSSSSPANNATINGSRINISGDITLGVSLQGTTDIYYVGTGTWFSSIYSFLNDFIINTSGTLILNGSIYCRSSSFTYLRGNVRTKNSIFYLPSTTTLINCNKINFDRVIITSGITITMNEFFSGSANLKTNVTASSTTNYTITFQDNFEKIAKFVKLTNCTITRRNQLLMLTNIPDKKTNIGIRYNNNLPNGVPKNDPSVSQSMTYGANYLTSDPCFN